MSKVQAKQVTISGSYYTNANDIESFSDVIGVLPDLDADKVNQMTIKRFAKIWIEAAKGEDGKPLSRVHRVREVYVDAVEEVEGEFSYIGKNIMNMTAEELQDLAAAKDLHGVPLYKVGSLALARRVAFSEYAIRVLGMDKEDLDYRKDGFNPNEYDAIIADASIRRGTEMAADIEEGIDREQLMLDKKLKPTAEPSRLTMEQLKAIASQKKVTFAGNISYDALYKRVYGKGGVAA